MPEYDDGRCFSPLSQCLSISLLDKRAREEELKGNFLDPPTNIHRVRVFIRKLFNEGWFDSETQPSPPPLNSPPQPSIPWSFYTSPSRHFRFPITNTTTNKKED